MGIEAVGAGRVGVSTAPLVRQEAAAPAVAPAAAEVTQARGTTDQMMLSDQARQRTNVAAKPGQSEDEAKDAARKAEEKTLFNKFIENLNLKALERILDEMKATANS